MNKLKGWHGLLLGIIVGVALVHLYQKKKSA